MTTTPNPTKVVPAQLSFLAIYNPSLGPTEETFQEQVVFYYSRAAHDARAAAKKNARNDAAGGDALRAEENEKLRQIGLAQGMVDFAKSFSNGEPVDSIETEKSRIVLHELENGWWILASIDLTRLPSLSQSSSISISKTTTDKTTPKSAVEYSTREISPPHLLLQQLLQAHRIFCLHHGPSLHDVFVKLTRDKFTSTLDRFWTRFARTWDVLLHGNPAADVFGGLKLAAGGELGFGVGEEEWGSGEREVLEDLARRTEGLVDLVVARFGEPASSSAEERKAEEDDEEAMPWMGAGVEPVASDGVIFGGVAKITRQSLRDVSLWMRQVYMYGDQAYGIRDNPLRERRKRRRREGARNNRQANGATKNDEPPPDEAIDFSADAPSQTQSTTEEPPTISANDDLHPNIPPPFISAASHTHPNPTAGADQEVEHSQSQDEEATDDVGTTLGIPDQYMKYLTFGLSTLGKQKRPSTARRTSAASTITPQAQTRSTAPKTAKSKAATVDENDRTPSMAHVDPMPDGEKLRSKIASQKKAENRGHFVIGLKGNLLELDELSEDDEQTELSEGDDGIKTDGSRIVLRTIQVELTPRDDADDGNGNLVPTPLSEDPPDRTSRLRRVRVVLYVHRPFMYCFLFASRTGSLQYTGFYKNLHRNLVPIHKPLLNSTSVEKVRQRIESSQLLPSVEDESEVRSIRSQKSTSARSPSRKETMNTNPIYDLIYDPQRLTLHTSIPNIPLPGTPAAEGFSGLLKASGSEAAPMSNWTRIEALNVHSQILNTLASVSSRKNEIERMSKTVRGWWVVWMKVAASPSGATGDDVDEAFTVAAKATSSVQTLHTNDAVAKGGDDEENYRIAFLVRKATDAPSSSAPKPASTGSKAVSSMLEVMSLGMAGRDDDTSGSTGDGWGPAAPAGALAGGMGVDARKYVQGLLSLNR